MVGESTTNAPKEYETQTARPVAPEDLRPGDYVAALHMYTEHLWSPFGMDHQPPRVVRVLEWPGARWLPMQVQEICLPFVLLKTPRGTHWVLDVRQYRLGRVSESFGRRLFEAIAAERQDETPASADGAAARE